MSRPAFKPNKTVNAGLPKAAVQRLFDQAGGVERVAARLGYRGTSHVYAMADGNDGAEIAFAQVVQLTGPETPAGAEYLAAIAGGVFLPLPMPASAIAALTAAAMREFAEAAALIVDRLSDGAMTPAEAADVLPDLAEGVRCINQLYSQVGDLARSKD